MGKLMREIIEHVGTVGNGYLGTPGTWGHRVPGDTGYPVPKLRTDAQHEIRSHKNTKTTKTQLFCFVPPIHQTVAA